MMSTLRVLVADDESDARDKVKRLLSRTHDAVVVAEASTGRETIERVRAVRPDLVLLDIRMPDLDGLRTAEALASNGPASPKVVFVTAYDEYAVRAFEVRAFDYLLKPFDAARLDAALVRVREQIDLEHRPQAAALRSLLERIQSEPVADAVIEKPPEARYLDRVCVQSAGRVQVVKLDEVEWIEACGNYARMHTPRGRPMLREALRRLSEKLDPAQFARIHRSAIVKLDAIREMRPCASGDYIIELASGTRLRLSRSYRAEVDRRLNRR